MLTHRLLQVILAIFLFIPACTRTEDKQQTQQAPVFKEIPQIQEVKPEKPLKIKLKRSAKDDYSWEISGDDVNEIIKADKMLRKALSSEK